MTRYVQHISGQGEKFELTDMWQGEDCVAWAVKLPGPSSFPYLALPKSEYRLVEPPKQFKDVTAECEVNDEAGRVAITHFAGYFNRVCVIDMGYRFRKVQLWTVQPWTNILGEAQWAFIIDQEVTD